MTWKSLFEAQFRCEGTRIWAVDSTSVSSYRAPINRFVGKLPNSPFTATWKYNDLVSSFTVLSLAQPGLYRSAPAVAVASFQVVYRRPAGSWPSLIAHSPSVLALPRHACVGAPNAAGL